MAVYVDRVRKVKPSAKWPYKTHCHLTADSPTELHAFAIRLGLKPEWFQQAKKYGKHSHYDLTGSMRRKAIELGAEAVKYISFALRSGRMK